MAGGREAVCKFVSIFQAMCSLNTRYI
jgi:hypothetical protein